MSAELQLVPDNTAMELTSVEVERFRLYLQRNLTDDTVLLILEECLLEENSTYNPIDFEEALKHLQQKDTGRYHMLKVLMEGYATKEGMVMVDPKLVTASFKQRLKELELLKAMSSLRRFWYRLGLAIKVLVGETTKTQALQEAIQVTGEVQVAKEELAIIELKKSQAARDADKILTDASSANRKIIEGANQRATEKTEEIYRKARQEVSKERTQAVALLESLHKQIDSARVQLNKSKSGVSGYKGFDFGESHSLSVSPSQSVSPSASLSPSLSPSVSHSPSV